jgi:hypothetical protein
MHTIDTSVVIAMRPQIVLQVLAELAAYEEWNPFILRADGDLVPGERITVFFTGVLAPFLGATLRRTEEGFHAMKPGPQGTGRTVRRFRSVLAVRVRAVLNE